MRQLIATVLVGFSMIASANNPVPVNSAPPLELTKASEDFRPYTCRAFDAFHKDVHGGHSASGPNVQSARAAALNQCLAFHPRCNVACGAKH